jgi:hypothetical protein
MYARPVASAFKCEWFGEGVRSAVLVVTITGPATMGAAQVMMERVAMEVYRSAVHSPGILLDVRRAVYDPNLLVDMMINQEWSKRGTPIFVGVPVAAVVPMGCMTQQLRLMSFQGAYKDIVTACFDDLERAQAWVARQAALAFALGRGPDRAAILRIA